MKTLILDEITALNIIVLGFFILVILGLMYFLLYQNSRIVYQKGYINYLQSVNKTLSEGLDAFIKKSK